MRGTITDLEVNSSIKVVNYASITSSATLTSVTTYTESGSTKALTVTSGKVVVENNGYVESLTLSSSSATLENSGYIATLTNNGSSNVTNKGYITGDSNNTSYTYQISNYTELANFRDKVNNGTTFAGITVELTADINLSNRVWVPIGYDSRDNAEDYHLGKTAVIYYYFAGTFEGNNHTISGLTNTGYTPTTVRKDTYGTGSRETENYLYGLFGIINGATIQNLTMTNVNIVSDSEIELDSVGAIAGFASGGVKITNCTVYGSIEATDAAAGIVGRIYTYDNGKCAQDGSNSYYKWASSGDKTAKNLNTWQTTVEISNCKNYASITITDTDNTTSKAAGIVSYFNDYSYCGITISSCENYGDVSANIYAAGIFADAGKSTVTLTSCKNEGDIISTNTTASGKTSNVGSIVCCTTTYTSSSKDSPTFSWTITSCSNNGTITSSGNGYVCDFNESDTYTATKTTIS